MKNFFYGDEFYGDIESLCDGLDLDDKSINDLSDDWSIEVEFCSPEPLITISADWILEQINDERWPEDKDDNGVYKRAQKALDLVDYDAINAAMPKLYYPNGKKHTITKKDLV